MSKFTFIYENAANLYKPDKVTDKITFESDGPDLEDLIYYFNRFLLACGYCKDLELEYHYGKEELLDEDIE